jgi:hypothetical protein
MFWMPDQVRHDKFGLFTRLSNFVNQTRRHSGNRFLIIWNHIGPAIILLPTFVFINYWMNEPGFIMEFPMVLAPSIVVPIFIFLNFLLAWRIFEITRKRRRS